MHACGHDMHVTWLAGATAAAGRRPRRLAGHRAGRLPARRGDRPGRPGDDRRRPVRPFPEAGRDPRPARHARTGGAIGYRPGTTQAAADSLEVRLFGRGAHGSMPESSVDPVVMAAATVLRLQTIVSRESRRRPGRGGHGRRAAGRHQGQRHPRRGRCSSSTSGRLTSRSARTSWTRSSGSWRPRRRLPGRPGRRRSPRPEHYPLTVNDPEPHGAGGDALRAQLGDDRVHELAAPYSASEDFGSFGDRVEASPRCSGTSAAPTPAVYRRAEQAGRVAQDIPTNHNAKFAPLIHPTLETGVQAMTTAARAWLSPEVHK